MVGRDAPNAAIPDGPRTRAMLYRRGMDPFASQAQPMELLTIFAIAAIVLVFLGALIWSVVRLLSGPRD